MDVFSLLKFWRHAGISADDDFHLSDDDESSFFDLVFTDDLKSKSTDDKYLSPHNSHTVFFHNKKTTILTQDASTTTKTPPKSPFRVLMLRFHSNNNTKYNNKDENEKEKEKKGVKCEVEEVTISSLLKRDNSLKASSRRFSKDAVQRYLSLIKVPLYVRRPNSNEKCSVRLTEHFSFGTASPATAPVKMFSPTREERPKVTGRAVFKEVRKHLGKSRSSSSAVVKPVALIGRRDDSALQQQDGIQSAILHCKRSYNSPSQGCHVLSRSGSAPSQGSRMSVDEEKRCSI